MCVVRCGALLAVEGLPGCCQWEWQAVLLMLTDWKHKAFGVACSERVHCANAFRMGISNSSFPTKSCRCASIAFSAGDPPCRKNLPVNVTPFLKRGNYKEIFRKFVSQLQASSPFCSYQPNSQFISIYIHNNARRSLTMEGDVVTGICFCCALGVVKLTAALISNGV